MSFLLSNMCRHIDGRKELTEGKPIVTIADDKISEICIPLQIGANVGTPLVKEGDRVLKGQLIAEATARFYVPFFSSVSGTVKGTKKMMGAQLRPIDYLVIENDFKNEESATLKIDYEKATKEELVDFMKKMGLLGQGGAGFPAYIKYGAKDVDLVINLAECEPYITTDVMCVEEELDMFKFGVEMAMKAAAAKSAHIGIKKTHKELIEKLEAAFKGTNIYVHAMRDVYPMGFERTLIKEMMHRTYDILPSECGCVVSNAQSLLSFGKTLKTGMPITERVITVSGEGVNNPMNIKCPVGTSVKALLETAGGVKLDECLLLMGGPMMGSSVTKDEICISRINGAVTVLPLPTEKAIGCLRCGKCVETCPMGLQPCLIAKAGKAKDQDALKALETKRCVECGACAYVCPSKINVTDNIRMAKRIMK